MNKISDRQISVAIGLFLGAMLVISLQWFWSMYYIQSPIRVSVHNPIQRRSVIKSKEVISPVPSPTITATPEARLRVPIVEASEIEILHTDIFDKVWLLESTKGKAPGGWHITCRNRGKWNEIGYNPKVTCFDNKEAGMKKLGDWFQNKFEKDYTLDEALCMWNVGKKLTSCEYSDVYRGL